MTTCDYAESLNNSTKETDYERLQTFFVQKRELFNALIKIIEDDNSTDEQIQQTRDSYNRYMYVGESPLLNIDCCKNSNNDYFYNIRDQKCITPVQKNGYKKYTGLSRGTDIGFLDNIKYSSVTEAETKCYKLCKDNPDKCKSFEISSSNDIIKCKYYEDISNKNIPYTIDDRSNMYIISNPDAKQIPTLPIVIGVSIGILLIIFIILIIIYNRKTNAR